MLDNAKDFTLTKPIKTHPLLLFRICEQRKSCLDYFLKIRLKKSCKTKTGAFIRARLGCFSPAEAGRLGIH